MKNKRLPTLITLLAWSGLLLWFRFSGRIAAYLHPQFHAYVVVAGVGLLVLAGLWWWASRGETGGCCGHDHGDHDHHHGRLTAGAVAGFVVLLGPVTAAALISPSQFGEAAVMNRIIVTDVNQLPSARPSFGDSWQDAPALGDGELPDIAEWPAEEEEGVEYFTRGPDGAIQLETIDLLFAAEEPALRDEFNNQRVSIIGQYVPPRGTVAGGFDLVRMFVVCCAADARPMGIKIISPDSVEVPRMGWVRITGTAKFQERGGRFEPSLEAEKIEPVEAPPERFVY
ncbi:MAG: TIGR03943 family protein [Chthoniobacterales bacterium]|nr:TIGR03943 family protein [Chthoniobacterales bacterium]